MNRVVGLKLVEVCRNSPTAKKREDDMTNRGMLGNMLAALHGC